ncbi:MAG: hypothetical protein M3Y32_06375 [Pseudomonadota bacterium]|nr:hypothetical protein [Pseudomonadota bacterium]
MKHTLMSALIAACTLLAGQAFAADASCSTQAADKKLHGAAMTSFMKKCEKDAGMAAPNEACMTTATEKKLAGAAKNSFMKKCEKDAMAAKH